MLTYVLRRLFFTVFIIFGVAVVVFFMANALPTDPAVAALGVGANQEMIDAMREELGLDEPTLVRFVEYLGRLVRGDFGRSIVTDRPVMTDLLERYPNTIELAFLSMLLSILVGVPLGVASARHARTWVDGLLRGIAISAAALPIFWVALMLQLIFYGRLGWLPAGGRLGTAADIETVTGFLVLDSIVSGNWRAMLDVARHLVLPVVSLSGLTLATIMRMTRSSMLDVMREPYVDTARSKGLTERTVLYRHVLRTAAIPIVTVIGLRFGHLLAGAVITESIFSWPGVGDYAVKAMLRNDYFAITAFVMTMTLFYALINLLTDISLAWLDPTVQYD
ncbi:MAG TPA: ABC transporter permease [Trueperaceae bacterium]